VREGAWEKVVEKIMSEENPKFDPAERRHISFLLSVLVNTVIELDDFTVKDKDLQSMCRRILGHVEAANTYTTKVHGAGCRKPEDR
jgi:hypothetical protein